MPLMHVFALIAAAREKNRRLSGRLDKVLWGRGKLFCWAFWLWSSIKRKSWQGFLFFGRSVGSMWETFSDQDIVPFDNWRSKRCSKKGKTLEKEPVSPTQID